MARITNLGQTVRNLRRFLEIVEVMIRYGFYDVIELLGAQRLVMRSRKILRKRPVPELMRLSRAERLRKAMEELGPTFIKLGQVLATRPDLIPRDWADEFKNLHDDCPTLPYSEIETTLEREFPGKLKALFKKIEHEPLAAASMAQVHRATLHDGAKVVLKVLRPGIREVTKADMEIMRQIAQFAESRLADLGYSPLEVVNEFARELRKEVDLVHEGKSTERLKSLFAEDEDIVFPAVHWQATTTNVLCVDEMHGTLISHFDPKTMPPTERRKLVTAGARAVIRQCLEFGFFHADPHPGNLFALPGGKVGFIDCGMTGRADPETMRNLADLVHGVVSNDPESVIRTIGQLTDAPLEKLEERVFRADVHEFISRFTDAQLQQLQMGALLRDFFDQLQEHQLRCPGDLVLLIKALSTIESVAEQIDPEFDLVEFTKPYVEQLLRRRIGFGAIRRRIERAMTGYTELLEQAPDEVRTLVKQLRRNRLSFKLEHKGLHDLEDTIEHASRNISFALIIAAMFVGSSILVLANKDPGWWQLSMVGIGGFMAAIALTVLMVISNRRRDRDD